MVDSALSTTAAVWKCMTLYQRLWVVDLITNISTAFGNGIQRPSSTNSSGYAQIRDRDGIAETGSACNTIATGRPRHILILSSNPAGVNHVYHCKAKLEVTCVAKGSCSIFLASPQSRAATLRPGCSGHTGFVSHLAYALLCVTSWHHPDESLKNQCLIVHWPAGTLAAIEIPHHWARSSEDQTLLHQRCPTNCSRIMLCRNKSIGCELMVESAR